MKKTFFVLLFLPFMLFSKEKEGVINDWQARLEYARLLRNSERYEDAIAQYQKLLNETPENATLKFELAELYSWQKNYEESLKLYQELLEKNPSDIQLRRKYAMVLMWMGKDNEAIKELESTLQ